MVNLVVIPLEGVSQMMLWQYRLEMPSLWRLYDRSAYFRRFYTSSTSAFQSFCDFVYGDSSMLDHNPFYPTGEDCLVDCSENLFGILAENGYATLGIQHGDVRPDYVKDNYFGAWPKACGEFSWHGDYDPFYAECESFIEKSTTGGKPFALYCCDRASGIGDDCKEKQECPGLHERIAKGFSLLDNTVERILSILDSQSLLENTLVVVYGPYGVDFWKHGIAGGKTRGIEPYADMCWTPLFIRFNGIEFQVVEAMANSIDLKATILGILLPKRKADNPGGQFSGLNLLSMGRTIAFSQNLFALERENEGPAKGLRKCYAATDGEMRLMISSNGGISGEGGMELYHDLHDPYNTRNLLDFFDLNQEGDMVSFGRTDTVHPHFTMSLKKNLVESIGESYSALRDSLRLFIQAKEDKSLTHCTQKKESMQFPEAQFRTKQQRRRGG